MIRTIRNFLIDYWRLMRGKHLFDHEPMCDCLPWPDKCPYCGGDAPVPNG